MSFFDDVDPEPEASMPRYLEPRWRRVPTERVPVAMPETVVLARTPLHAIVLHRLEVYPSGITFAVRTVRHPEDETADGARIRDLLGPYKPGNMRVGLLWSDGRRATNDTREWHDDGTTPPPTVLTPRGGSADDYWSQTTYWAWPLPEEGDLTVIVVWDEGQVAEHRHTIDGDALRAAAARSTELWPGAEVPEPEPEPRD